MRVWLNRTDLCPDFQLQSLIVVMIVVHSKKHDLIIDCIQYSKKYDLIIDLFILNAILVYD